MANGRVYQVQRKMFHWVGPNGHTYADVTGYYVPGSGEFLWWGLEYNEHGYRDDLKHEKMECPSRGGIVELVDGELAEFWGNNGVIQVFHSRLRFSSFKKAWEYVAEHPDETSSWLGGKWAALIDLDELGDHFFRPEKLWLDARPYVYDSLAGVKKDGSDWVLEIKGADEPNRAEAVLDGDFKLVKVTRR